MADADDQCIGQFAFEDVHQCQCGFVVELVGGFIEEQDLRFVQQCAGKAEPLLPSSNTHSGAQALRVIPESSLQFAAALGVDGQVLQDEDAACFVAGR